MTSVQPELWVERADAAIAYYRDAFGAEVRHQVGERDQLVAQLAVGDAEFWVSSADPASNRLSPSSIGGATGRTLLVVDDPSAVLEQAVAAGGVQVAPVQEEHGWRLGRITDPFGHEWEIGTPVIAWPPR